jgi:hypothetical protein
MKNPHKNRPNLADMTELQKQEYCNKLLNDGLSITQVARTTGLTEEFVSEARDTYKKYIVK